ncbi:MAG: IS21 family transposase, partial [Peptostreptococcaceae bacterium]|nr:IS21 family transposase [Peptostreptococcaceae bacterium]
DVKEKDDEDLIDWFFPEKQLSKTIYEKPDYDKCQKELAKTGVTLKLLWQEYYDLCEAKGTVSIWYGKFCQGYHEYTGTRNVTNHLEHKPGQIIEVDWSGPTMAVTDEVTGLQYKAYLFVATLPYSQYSYVEATLNMKQATWIRCNVNMFEYINGITRTIVCDNLKTGVIKHPKEGDVIYNKQYEEFGDHYCIAIMAAPPRKPKRKASVEGTVGKIATAIIATLRDEVFFSLQSLNNAIKEKLFGFNNNPFQKRYDGKYSRQDIFKGNEKEFLRSLPEIPYEYGIWIFGRKVSPSSHIQYKKNYYSCNFKYVGEKVDLKITDNLLRIYYHNKHLVTHQLFPEYITYKYKTRLQDMPKYFDNIEWDDKRILNWAKSIGSNTVKVIETIFSSVKIKEQGYNSSLSILRLSKKHTKKEFEIACNYALKKVSVPRYKHIKAILHSQVMNNLIEENEKETQKGKGIMRGSEYFKKIK